MKNKEIIRIYQEGKLNSFIRYSLYIFLFVLSFAFFNYIYYIVIAKNEVVIGEIIDNALLLYMILFVFFLILSPILWIIVKRLNTRV